MIFWETLHKDLNDSEGRLSSSHREPLSMRSKHNSTEKWVHVTIDEAVLRGKKIREEKPIPRRLRPEYDVVNIDFMTSNRCEKPKRSTTNKTNPCSPECMPLYIRPSSSILLPSTTATSRPHTPKKKRLKKCAVRIAELAVPSKRQFIDTWRNKSYILPDFMVDRLKQHVLDQRPVVQISDAINCFQRRRHQSPTRCSKNKKIRKKVWRQSYGKEANHFCLKFGSRIMKKLSIPPKIMYNPSLESLSQIVSEEISKMLQGGSKNLQSPRNNAIQIDVSRRVAIWIACVLQDLDAKLLEEDLRELEEQEGPVLDLLDELVDKVLDICAPLPLDDMTESIAESINESITLSIPESEKETMETGQIFIKNDLLESILDHIDTPINVVTAILGEILHAFEKEQFGETEESLSIAGYFENEIVIILDKLQDPYMNNKPESNSLSKNTNEELTDSHDDIIRDDVLTNDDGQVMGNNELTDSNGDIVGNDILINNSHQAMEHDDKDVEIIGNDGLTDNDDDVIEDDGFTDNDDHVIEDDGFTDKNDTIMEDNQPENENIDEIVNDANENNSYGAGAESGNIDKTLYDSLEIGTDEAGTEYANSDDVLEDLGDENSSKKVVNPGGEPFKNFRGTNDSYDSVTRKQLLSYTKSDIKPMITFSEPNLNLLNKADEIWPPQFDILKFNERFNANKSNASLRPILESYDVLSTLTDKVENEMNIQNDSGEILKNFIPMAKHDVECQTDDITNKEVILISASTSMTGHDMENENTIVVDNSTPYKKSDHKTIKKEINANVSYKKSSSPDNYIDEKKLHYSTEKLENDWKVHPTAVPSWVRQVRGDSDDSLRRTKEPLRLDESNVLKWCNDMEKAFMNLEIWNNWLDHAWKQVARLQKRRECICPNVKKHDKRTWIQTKKNIDKDAILLTKIYQRTQQAFKMYTSNYNNIEIISTDYCICNNNRQMAALINAKNK